jgi:hypothetical protein
LKLLVKEDTCSLRIPKWYMYRDGGCKYLSLRYIQGKSLQYIVQREPVQEVVENDCAWEFIQYISKRHKFRGGGMKNLVIRGIF